MAIALDYTQVDISDDGATFGTAIRTQFQNAQSDLGNRPEKNGDENILGNWNFGIGDVVFNDGFESTGLADFSAGQVDIRTRMYFKNNGVMQFDNNPTHDGACAFGGDISFDNKYLYMYLTTAETITDSPTYTVIPFDNIVRSDALYSSTSGVVTINKGGWYKISYSVEFTNTAGSNCHVKSIIEKDTGSGFAEVPNSELSIYSSQNINFNRNAGNKSVIIELNVNDKIRVSSAVMTQLPSSGSISTTANLCDIEIEKI